MKFLVVAAVLGLVALGAQAQLSFSDELLQFNDQFNEFHSNVDYFLRLQRMNTSDMMEVQNRMALETIWDSVLRLKYTTEVANDRLIYVALEVGNQNPCIVALFNELQQEELAAGDSISTCAANMYRSQQNAINGGFFSTVDTAQRNSHFLQIITLYTLGLHNTVTEQAAIRNELNGLWNDRESVRNAAQIQEEQYYIQVALQTARINLNNCMLVIEGLYRDVADSITTRANSCEA